MIKKWLALLSRYPRLRILLVIFFAIVVLITLVNLFSDKAVPEQSKLPPSQVVRAPHAAIQERSVGQEIIQTPTQDSTAQVQKPVETKPTPPAKRPGHLFSNIFNNDVPPPPPPLNSTENSGAKVAKAAKQSAADEENGENEARAFSASNHASSESTTQANQNPAHKPLTPEQIAMAKSLSSAMQSYLSSNSKSWTLPTQQVVAGSNTNTALPGNGSAGSQPVGNLLKAGSILFAVLDNGLSSDAPGTPVLAEVVTGKYRGAKLIGTFTSQINTQYPTQTSGLVIQFTLMSMPQWAASVPISAYAIDPNTGANALASDINHHYVMRYSSLLAASFLQGYGQAYANAANNAGCVAPGGGTCEITNGGTVPQPSSKSALFQGLGQVGTNMSQSAMQNFNTPPTVTLDKGAGMGILFLQDTQLPSTDNDQ